MQVLSARLALTGALATLLWAVPVSIDLGRPGSANATMSPALGIGLKIDSAAAAQQPSQAQVNAIRAACRADFQTHCAGVQPGGSAALACLKKNVATLSTGCQKAVGDVGGASAPAQSASDVPAAPPAAPAAVATAPAAAPAAPPPAARPAAAAPRADMPVGVELAILRRACGPDVQANCPGVRPGGGQVIACLVANQTALSPGCRRALASAR